MFDEEDEKDLEKAENKGRVGKIIRIMIIGVPNVGKSSIINKLTGRKSTVTGDRPGVTKGKQWVRLKGNLELLDTPGILWPKFEDQDVALNLAFCRAIKDEILDVETLALRLIGKLMEIEPEKLKARYKLEELGDRDIETMDMIGRKRGFIMGNKELDYTRIATTVLNEFRDGKIGKITLEVPEDIKKQIQYKKYHLMLDDIFLRIRKLYHEKSGKFMDISNINFIKVKMIF